MKPLQHAAVTAPRNTRRDECVGWILAGGGRGGGAETSTGGIEVVVV